jgi:hypothetical protein
LNCYWGCTCYGNFVAKGLSELAEKLAVFPLAKKLLEGATLGMKGLTTGGWV